MSKPKGPRAEPARVIGIETEFGCLVRDSALGAPESVVETVKDFAFLEKRIGLIDLHSRNYAFEPARSGGFLLNGGRLYVDEVGSHEEYATPECRSVFDAAAHDRAGRVILQSLLDELGYSERVSFHNNSIDHFGGHTFGCHENYLVTADEDLYTTGMQVLLPFLVTRQIFAGVGRVGGHRLNRSDFRKNVMRLGEYEVDYAWVDNLYGVELDDSVRFQLSQRADHIIRTVSGRVRFNRAIVNPKHDTFFEYGNRHRLHLLFGEANMSEYANVLKLGTTSIVLELLESGLIPEEVRLANPLGALKAVSRDQTLRWPVRRADGTTIGAIDVQREYLRLALLDLAGRDSETDWILREWEETLDALEADPLSTSDRLDWAMKRRLLEEFVAETGARWDDDVLQSLDLEYHNLNPRTGLYYGLEQEGLVRRVLSDKAISAAVNSPPSDTRALGRARAIAGIMFSTCDTYVIDWDVVHTDRRRFLPMPDPLCSYAEEAGAFVRDLYAC
jgi:proteasome accessory factor A